MHFPFYGTLGCNANPRKNRTALSKFSWKLNYLTYIYQKVSKQPFSQNVSIFYIQNSYNITQSYSELAFDVE